MEARRAKYAKHKEERAHACAALMEKGFNMKKIGDGTHLVWLITNFVNLAGIDASTVVDRRCGTRRDDALAGGVRAGTLAARLPPPAPCGRRAPRAPRRRRRPAASSVRARAPCCTAPALLPTLSAPPQQVSRAQRASAGRAAE
jgi:hypothetical protein